MARIINNSIPSLDELIKNHKTLRKNKEIIATIDKEYYFMVMDKLIEEFERQESMIKNALKIIIADEKEKVDKEWLYYFDKCAELKK